MEKTISTPEAEETRVSAQILLSLFCLLFSIVSHSENRFFSFDLSYRKSFKKASNFNKSVVFSLWTVPGAISLASDIHKIGPWQLGPTFFLKLATGSKQIWKAYLHDPSWRDNCQRTTEWPAQLLAIIRNILREVNCANEPPSIKKPQLSDQMEPCKCVGQ